MVFKPGEKHPFFGKLRPKNVCEKISKSHVGIRPTEESKRKNADTHSGNPLSLEHRKHISESMVGINAGKNNPMFGKSPWNKGKSHLPGEKNPQYGKRGVKSAGWRGGKSFEPYCYMFNPRFKQRVRAFFEYQCVECEKTQTENGRLLSVHHVNYDKMTCCNNAKPIFVALCQTHNAMANGSRGFWEDWYTEIVNEFYGGRCYLPEEVKM